MSFTFIHAADLHVDSPLAALGAKDADVAKLFALAGRKAVQALIDEAITSKAAFLLIAGDIFDGDWKDVATGMFMVGELARLARAGIPAFIIKGNHDADSVVSGNLPYPETVKVFGGKKAETHLLEHIGVALHGRSFPHRVPPDGFVDSYPAAVAGYLNIGLLHTALDGTRGDHAPYAPCSVAQLQRLGYDYWALGHIHQQQIVEQNPWIVYSGNIQGRSVRETGAKGAMRVSVADGRITSVTPVILDAARWANDRLDISHCLSEADIHAAMAGHFTGVHAQAENRPVALRLTLHGTNALHPRLMARQQEMLDEARARALHVGADFWVERIILATRAPKIVASAEPDDLNVSALLQAAVDAPEMPSLAQEAAQTFAGKLPVSLRQEFSDLVMADALAQAHALLLGRLDFERSEPE